MPGAHDISYGPDQSSNEYLNNEDEDLLGGRQMIIEDFLELAAPSVFELQVDALLSVQTGYGSNFVTGFDASGAFLEIRP